MRFWQADLTGSGQKHIFLLVTTRVWNAGEGAFELDRVTDESLGSTLVQRVYDRALGFTDHRIDGLAVDPPVFRAPRMVRVEIWDKREYVRAASHGFRRGAPLFRKSQSFCVGDGQQVDPAAVPAQHYTCNAIQQGISVGWSKVEQAGDTAHWVDLGVDPLADGEYVLRAIADPDNLYIESDNKTDPEREGQVANSSRAFFRVSSGNLAGT